MEEETFWALAFISLVSIKEHPRNEKGADTEACADLADEMLYLYQRHKQENPKCHGG